MPLIRAVLFDYGLVLSGPPDPAAWRRMQTILNATDPAFHDAYWRHRHDYDLGALSGVSFWQTVASELNHPLTDDELTQLITADIDLWTQPNQPMIDWACAVQRAGIPTAILSNIGDAMETGVLDRCPWLAGFAHRTFSHRLLIAKPDPRIYTHAIAALSTPADEILFIDDRIENIEAARAAGLEAIHYTSHDAFLRALETSRYDGLPTPANASATP